MWLQSIVLVALVFFLYHLVQDEKFVTRKERALCLHLDMIEKIRELIDDPTMTKQKWLEWAKVFAFADDQINRELGKGTAHLTERAKNWAKELG